MLLNLKSIKKQLIQILTNISISFFLLKILEHKLEEPETLDITITGRSCEKLIVRHMSTKKHLSCSSEELLDELSTTFPCK